MAEAQSCTVIIPAYNEEAVIARCLSTLMRDAPPDHGLEVIVAANGCTDATVELAKAQAPTAKIINLAQGSKTAAINAANAIASHFPRIYLDADVECDYATITALADAVSEAGVMTAAPAIRINAERSDGLVKAYYRVWARQPYAHSGNGGAGCYALSRDALETIGAFPATIGDDIWIHTRFAPEQKRYVVKDGHGKPVFTTVYPPRNALEQIKVEARRQLGNAQVLRDFPSPFAFKLGGRNGLQAALKGDAKALDVAIFFVMKFCARGLAVIQKLSGRSAVWSRDQTSRQL
jgi:glycosyltransferase involved in cell wall biosynthesis